MRDSPQPFSSSLTLGAALALLTSACGGNAAKSGTQTSGDGQQTVSSATSNTNGGNTGPTGTGGSDTSSSNSGTTSASTGSGGAGGSANASGTQSSSSGGGTSSGGNAGSGGGLDCPAAPPDDGSPCDISTEGFPGAHCSWGDDVRPECRTRAVCQGNAWSVQQPVDASCDAPPMPSGCLSEPPENGTTCEEANLECWYDDGTRCQCSPCEGGSGYPVCGVVDPPEWWCNTPPSECPVPAPQAGTACDNPELDCGLDCTLPIVCVEGAWQYGQDFCPICAAPETPVATPSGEQPIAELKVGDLVYTVRDDAIVPAPILRVGSTKVYSHRVLRVVLNDGSMIEMSPGHPTSDGRTFADLAPGDFLDATHQVISSTLIPFDATRTHDILPDSPSGVYFASGALVGSTLLR